MTGIRRVSLALAACVLAGALPAQTYVGNLNGTASSSTFEGLNQLPLGDHFTGWSTVSGSNVIVFDFDNNVVINLSGTGYESYEVVYEPAIALLPNSTYTLSFTMGYVADPARTVGLATYYFSLSETDTVTTTLLQSTSGGPVSPNGGAFATTNPNGSITASLNYTTGSTVSGLPMLVHWSSTNPGNDGSGHANYFGFDNVTLSYVSAIPEPSTYAALAGLAVLGFVIWHRHRNS